MRIHVSPLHSLNPCSHHASQPPNFMILSDCVLPCPTPLLNPCLPPPPCFCPSLWTSFREPGPHWDHFVSFGPILWGSSLFHNVFLEYIVLWEEETWDTPVPCQWTCPQDKVNPWGLEAAQPLWLLFSEWLVSPLAVWNVSSWLWSYPITLCFSYLL